MKTTNNLPVNSRSLASSSVGLVSAVSNIGKPALLTSGLLMVAACNPFAASQTEAPAPALPAIDVAQVLYQTITEWDEYTGRLEATETVELRPRVSGYISEVLFKEGSMVSEGEPLFRIDPASFQTEVDRLDAELSSAKSQADLANSEYNRAKRLIEQNAISAEIFEARAAQKAMTAAQLQSVSADLRLARLNLGYTEVKAPISGRVSFAELTKGNYVTAGQSMLTSIVSTDQIYAYFQADERAYLKYVNLAREGRRPSARDTESPVLMALATDTDYPYEGHINFVDNQIDPETSTMRARAVFDNSDGTLVPGLFARIRVAGSASYESVLINDRAIGTDLDSKYVLILDENNSVQYRSVTLGEKVGGLRIVKQGLSQNDVIVVRGLGHVRSGRKIAPLIQPMASADVLQYLQALQARVDGITSDSKLANKSQAQKSANELHKSLNGLNTEVGS